MLEKFIILPIKIISIRKKTCCVPCFNARAHCGARKKNIVAKKKNLEKREQTRRQNKTK